MRIEPGSRDYTICRRFTPEDGETIFPVVDNRLSILRSRLPSLPDETIVNGHLTDLRGIIDINSLDEVPAPSFDVAVDTESTRLAKVMQAKWESARIHLALWITDKEFPTVADWIWIGDVSCQNAAGNPFNYTDPKRNITSNLTFGVGENAKLGMSVRYIMFNNELLALAPGDTLNIFGNWRQDFFAVQPDILPQPTIIQGTIQQVTERFDRLRWNVGATARTTLMELRDNRTSGLIKNIGATNTLYVKEGSPVSTTDFSYTIAAGGQRGTTVGYHGIVTAITQSGSTAVETEEKYLVPAT